jgi:hypothetical protein
MTCQRCGSSMLEFGITFSGDALTQKRISALYCGNCNRFEYGTRVDTSPIPPPTPTEDVLII